PEAEGAAGQGRRLLRRRPGATAADGLTVRRRHWPLRAAGMNQAAGLSQAPRAGGTRGQPGGLAVPRREGGGQGCRVRGKGWGVTGARRLPWGLAGWRGYSFRHARGCHIPLLALFGTPPRGGGVTPPGG